MQNKIFTFNIHATGANSILGYYYELEGIIYREDGSVCELCDVTMHSTPITTKTSSTGYYYFEEIAVGRHTLIVEDNGTEIINDKFVLKQAETSSVIDKEVSLSSSDAITFKASSDNKISEINIKDQDSLIVRKSDTFNYFLGTNQSITELFTLDTLITNGGTTVCKELDTTITNINELNIGVHTVRCTATTQLGNNQVSSVTINVDDTIPTITAKQTINNITTGTSRLVAEFFNMNEYSYTSGTTECKINNNIVTNINTLSDGTYTLSCSMRTGTNKTATSSTTINLDNVTPTITAKQELNNLTTGESKLPTELFNMNEYSYTGGTTVCKVNNNTITNLNTLSDGTYTLTCTMTTGLNKTATSSTVIKLDNVTPVITAKSSTNTEIQGTSRTITNFFNISSYGETGGLTVCKVGSTISTNISSLGIGTYTLSCTMTTGTGKTASASTSLTIVQRTFTMYEKILDLRNYYNRYDQIDVHYQSDTSQTSATTEYRYYGSDPDNYIYYNCKDNDSSGRKYGVTNYDYQNSCEVWRIIGAFETETPIYSGSTIVGYTTENRVKIIRKDSIGSFSFDSTSSSINAGTGTNSWNNSALMTTLNSGAYWNRTNGTCYNSYYKATTSCNFSTTGLTTTAKSLITPAKFYLGGANIWANTVEQHYQGERGTVNKTCTNVQDADGSYYCNDTVTRNTSWTGNVGLMYPSDYGYAAGSTTADNTVTSNYTYEFIDDWLYVSQSYQVTISPINDSTHATYIFSVFPSGIIYANFSSYATIIRPVVYLKSNIIYKDGQGTISSPYIVDQSS